MSSFFNHFRDCQQITFVTLNRFYALSISFSPSLPVLNEKAGWNTILNEKYTLTGSILFQVLKLLLTKRCSYQFFITIWFYINRYHFLHFSSLHSTLSEKRFSSQTFTFFNRFTPTLQPP